MKAKRLALSALVLGLVIVAGCAHLQPLTNGPVGMAVSCALRDDRLSLVATDPAAARDWLDGVIARSKQARALAQAGQIEEAGKFALHIVSDVEGVIVSARNCIGR